MPAKMTDAPIDIKEYIDLQIKHERETTELRITHERDLRLAAEAAVTASGKVATDELARRLHILNGAHEDAVRVQSTYVPRETFDNRIREDETQRTRDTAERKQTAMDLEKKVEEAKSVAALALDKAASGIDERIKPLEEARFKQAGVASQLITGKADNQWVVGLVFSIPSVMVAIAAMVLLFNQAN